MACTAAELRSIAQHFSPDAVSMAVVDLLGRGVLLAQMRLALRLRLVLQRTLDAIELVACMALAAVDGVEYSNYLLWVDYVSNRTIA